jgi:DNA-binding LacI/PurR family transcriptional regulator
MPKTSLKKHKEITIKDIAEASGVSVTTVSRVLSKSSYPVSVEIRNSVLKMAREMSYQPNLGFKSRKIFENEIAVLIPTFSNPFYTSMVTGFESAAVTEGFHTMVYDVGSWLNRGSVNQLFYSVMRKNIKGMLIAAPSVYPLAEEFRRDFDDRGIKVVMADCPKPYEFFNSVYFDYKKGSFMATEYLLLKGHRKLVYAGLELERESRELRVQGFKDALNAHGIQLSPENVLIYSGRETTENTQIESGEELARMVLALKDKPTAIAVINDNVAFGMLREFHKLKINIPREFSIIGFDDSVFCEMSYPALTTVKVQSEHMGRMAAILLLNDLQGESGAPVGLSLEPCIIERDSVLENKPQEAQK